MPNTLEGQTAIVTGAVRSIGRAIALRLASEGANIVVHYRSRPEEAEETARLVQAAGGNAQTCAGDLTQPYAVARLFDVADQTFGRPDIVVANAGVTVEKPVADLSDEDIRFLFETNTIGTFYVLREAARRIADNGRIVNLSSSTTWFASSEHGGYGASKAGARIATEVISKELGARGVRANSVVAGPIDDGFLADGPADVKARLAALSPFNRLGTPEEVAAVVAFLVSEDSRWISGQNLLVNGAASV